MNKIIAPITENPEQRQLSVAKVMDVALAPFRLREELTDAKLLAWQVRHLVERNSDGEIVALKRATDQPQRWRLHCDAHEAIDMMPPLKQIHSAYQTIANSIITKPTYTERKMLAGMLLDGCGIRADEGTAAWVEAVAWTLGGRTSGSPRSCRRRMTAIRMMTGPTMSRRKEANRERKRRRAHLTDLAAGGRRVANLVPGWPVDRSFTFPCSR
jgi:hypothetical protein